MSRQQRSPIIQILLVLIAVLFVADVIVIGLCLKTPGSTKSNQKPSASQGGSNTPSPTDGTEVPTEEAPQLVSTATVLSTGDILMHGKVINSGKQDDGSYNFDSIFQYVKSYSQAADFSVANLETTLCGTDNGYAYAGNPKFNCPDAIVDSLKGAGFDMLLTANNHADDTSLVGYKRTLNVVREKGLDTLGTYLSADEQKWTIEEVNGIKIGMVCYTYSDGFSQNGYPLLNYNEVGENGILNYFTYDKLPEFYTQLQGYLDEMKAAGAEATVVYLHWGEEYKWKTGEGPNANQTAMAQKLCDMGVDVIVGGHPHVVQPVDLLTSGTDAEHKTIVLYSMGNAVSIIIGQQLGAGEIEEANRPYRRRRTLLRHLCQILRRQRICRQRRADPHLGEYARQFRRHGVQHSPPGRIHRRPVAGPVWPDRHPAGECQGIL